MMKRRFSMTLLALGMFGCSHAPTDGSPTSTPDDTGVALELDERGVAAPKHDGDESDHHRAAASEPMATAVAVARPGVAARRPSPAPSKSGSGFAPRHDAAAGGPVKAGQWDDNANYREFQRFIEASSYLDFQRLDLRHRRFVVVRDNDGKGVPSCPVTVSDGRRSMIVTTAASGRAIVFPHAEGLSGQTLSATARCADDQKTVHFTLAESDGVVDLRLDTRRSLPQTPQLEVAFILDTTGSMAEEIAAVKSTIQKVASSLSQSNVQLRLGLVEYKDRTDDFVTKVYPMSSDLQSFARRVSSIDASGGGDTPEDAAEGLRVGINNLQWSSSSVARMAFLIGDAPPHLDYQDANYVRDMKKASYKGIKVFTVAASGMDDLGQVVWRQIAQYTGGTNMFVKRGGAGPQSTGGGDPKTSCGGTHQNYRSGNLDQLIVAKVERELLDLHASPLRIAGLRIDEDARPCHERVARQ